MTPHLPLKRPVTATLSRLLPAGFKAFAAVEAAGSGVGEFFPAPKFMGARPGYYFGLGPLGLGYYIDSKGDSKLFQQAKAVISNSSSNSSVAAKKRPPPKGPPPAWALEGKSVAPSA